MTPEPKTSVAADATPAIDWPDAQREAAFERWLAPLVVTHRLQRASLRPASADASFRRYFRIDGEQGSCVVMDAPPPQEDVRPFVHVAGLIQQAGLHGPAVRACDEAQGFLLLDDLGRTLYLDVLKDANARQADQLMRDAIAALVQWQQRVPHDSLPRYDAALLRRELALFPEWCVQREFGVHWTGPQQAAWERLSALLVASALAQPVVAVHRDWMPRNLMVADPNPGILDFQDAVAGPITYDMASLLRDAFVSWDEEREIDWAVRHWEQLRRAGLFGDGGQGPQLAEDFGEYWRALEWMGLQRHLKVLGIFCRLKHRDGKPRYAQDLPRFFAYLVKVATRYRPLEPLIGLIEPMCGSLISTGFDLR